MFHLPLIPVSFDLSALISFCNWRAFYETTRDFKLSMSVWRASTFSSVLLLGVMRSIDLLGSGRSIMVSLLSKYGAYFSKLPSVRSILFFRRD